MFENLLPLLSEINREYNTANFYFIALIIISLFAFFTRISVKGLLILCYQSLVCFFMFNAEDLLLFSFFFCSLGLSEIKGWNLEIIKNFNIKNFFIILFSFIIFGLGLFTVYYEAQTFSFERIILLQKEAGGAGPLFLGLFFIFFSLISFLKIFPFHNFFISTFNVRNFPLLFAYGAAFIFLVKKTIFPFEQMTFGFSMIGVVTGLCLLMSLISSVFVLIEDNFSRLLTWFTMGNLGIIFFSSRFSIAEPNLLIYLLLSLSTQMFIFLLVPKLNEGELKISDLQLFFTKNPLISIFCFIAFYIHFSGPFTYFFNWKVEIFRNFFQQMLMYERIFYILSFILLHLSIIRVFSGFIKSSEKTVVS